MAPQKRLSWEEWQRRANADYVKGEFGVQQMISSWGYPEGMSAETHKIEFDKGKAKRKDRAGRRTQRTKYNAKRQAAATSQTVGENVYGKGVIAPKGSGLEEHHKRIVTVYAPFFEGLNPKETKELAQWFVDEGSPLGNVEENLEAAKKVEHSAIHEWTKNNFIEPKTGKPLLNFKNYTLNERLVPALLFLEQVQPAVDEKLAEIKGNVVKPKSNLMPNRAALTALAAGGIATLGPLSSAASAAETTGRTQLAVQTKDPADIVQAGIAGLSTLGDLATYNPVTAIPGEVVSTAADVSNVIIDKYRAPKPQGIQADQLIPTPKPVMANTPTGVAQLKAMPKSKGIDVMNELEYFLVKPIGSAFNRIFGKREI